MVCVVQAENAQMDGSLEKHMELEQARSAQPAVYPNGTGYAGVVGS